jgi:hypothetical protein
MMATQAACIAAPARLMQMSSAVVLQQTLYAAAKLGLADSLENGLRTASDLAGHLNVNEPALLRAIRFLAGQGVFEEPEPGVFKNNEISHFLRSGVHSSLRSFVLMRGSNMFFAPFGEILYSIETGLPAREKLCGKNGFEQLSEDPEMARIFDDAMTNLSEWLGPAIAAAYDFGAWGSLMDVGGGHGMLLAAILRAHPGLHGVLADLPAVVGRAEERGFLAGDLNQRSTLRSCDFFQEVPTGCRAYLMKNVIHDWDDAGALKILINCRRAVPDDGALLLAQWAIPGASSPSAGQFMDIAMMVLTGGRERDVEEYRELLSRAGFRLNRVFPVPGDFSVIEALPV